MPQQFQLLCKLVRLCHFFNCKSFVVLFTIGVFECFFFGNSISSWKNLDVKNSPRVLLRWFLFKVRVVKRLLYNQSIDFSELAYN